MLKKVNTATLLVVLLSGSLAIAQTNTTRPSTEGVWKMDLKQSKFTSDAPPKSGTLTILKDTPDALAWRYEEVDAKGKSCTVSWSGPLDGSLQDAKAGDCPAMGKQGIKRDGDVVLRHIEVPSVGSVDSRVTMSADGNTFTDVVTVKLQDGKTATDTVVFHRVPGGKPSSK
jgi:hypothetical protein